MAMAPVNLMEYLRQLCLTATKENVTVEKAFITNRLKFYCHKCFSTLTSPMPDSATVVDYQIQEFLTIHAHKGGHCNHHWTYLDDNSGRVCARCQLFEKHQNPEGVIPAAQGLTIDFKYVTGGLGSAPGGQIQTFTAGKIDDDPKNAAIINSKMAAYDAEMKQKALTQEINVKILQVQAAAEALQKTKAGAASLIESGLLDATALEDMIEQQQVLQNQLIEEQKAKQTALENILKLKDLKEQSDALSGVMSGIHTSTPKPKIKPLKIETGRKFR